MRRCWLAGACLLAATARAAEPTAGPVVEYRQERVTVRAEAAPRADVVVALARATGAELRGTVADPSPVTVTLDAVPLDDALHRLLGDQSFTVTYGDGDRVRTIALKGGPQATPPGGLAAGAAVIAESPLWQTDDRLKAAVAVLGGVAQRELPLHGRLAKAIGAPSATFERLAQAALIDHDPHVRVRALRAALGMLEGDPELRDALATTVTILPPETMAHFSRELASDGALAFAERVARFSHSNDVRAQAQVVAGLLRHPD